MIFGLICVSLHLFLIFYVGETVEFLTLARGISANFIMGCIIAFLFNLIKLKSYRYFLFCLVASVIALIHSHVILNGSYPNLLHVALINDKTFLLSVVSDISIQQRIFLYVVLVISLIYFGEKIDVKNKVLKNIYISIFLICIVLDTGIYFCAHCENFRWQANSILDYYLVNNSNEHLNSEGVVYDGRNLVSGDINSGKTIFKGNEENVILLMIEGLSQHHIEQNYTPEIKKIIDKGLRINHFVSHQRHTNRGMFSVLCGAYPNLKHAEAKPDFIALGGLSHECLPHRLQENNYETIFMQAAPLGYMSKDLFAKKVGFDKVYGEKYFDKAEFKGAWGVDDKSFYKGVINYLKSKNTNKPYFISLLTSGTHPPYKTPTSNNNYKKSFEFASQSLDWFYKELLQEGLLENTILIITSDESSASKISRVNNMDIASDNNGFLSALINKDIPTTNNNLFGQVDIPISILDYLKIDHSGFSGRSFFRSYSKNRLLYAGNTFRKLIYQYDDTGLVQCDYKFNCVKYDRALRAESEIKLRRNSIKADEKTVNSIKKFISKNDIDSNILDDYLVRLPEKKYKDKKSYQLIGRYVTDIPIGDVINVNVNINNNINKFRSDDLQFVWLAYDCDDINPDSIRFNMNIPANMAEFNLDFDVGQIHLAQCHKVWVNAKNEKNSMPWALEKFEIKKVPSFFEEEKVSRPDEIQSRPRVAHAGGIYNNMDYTNTYEAINKSSLNGFNYFEIDFSWTSDNHLVCLHDWEASFNKVFGFNVNSIPDLQTFNNYVSNNETMKACTIYDLADWLKNNPDKRIITDIKSDNLKGLLQISEILGKNISQVIPQIYHHSEYKMVKKLGFKKIIWTLYRFKGSENTILNISDRMNLYAITMPENLARKGLGIELGKRKLPTYVHTINKKEIADEYLNKFDITEIYTDSLYPD